MKAAKQSSLSTLPIDVAEYLFIEWLVRQGVFSAYKANLEKFTTSHQTFRESLRVYVRTLFRLSRNGIENIITVSFPFKLTPEGYDFWVNQVASWRRFYNEFKSTL